MATTKAATLRDRVVELRRVPAGDLIPNPKNWRKHPARQREALRALLSTIGIAGAVAARETPEGLVLIDGHLRQEEIDQEVPVLVLDVTEDEADTLLATYDPIAAMAEAGAAELDRLARDVRTEHPAIDQLIADTAKAAGLYLEAGAVAAPPAPEDDDGGNYREQYGVIVICRDAAHQEEVYNTLMAGGYECRVVVT